MGVFEHFPYVNFHELNLSWIINKLKELEDVIGTQIVDIVARAGVAQNAQDIADLTTTVNNNATTAHNEASAAQTTADTALSTANTAQSTATSAETTANSASASVQQLATEMPRHYLHNADKTFSNVVIPTTGYVKLGSFEEDVLIPTGNFIVSFYIRGWSGSTGTLSGNCISCL